MTRILLLTATFLSAFLLFIVQPLYAKHLLPFFGGTSSVWTISVFFYSSTLLLGYLYASLLTSWSNKVAWLVHSTLLLLATTLLLSRWISGDSPLLVDAVTGYSPAYSVLLTLLLGVGLPVLLLASTSVITQFLYARYTTAEPYALFALSNVGSLLGLAIYPFVFEPYTKVPAQSVWWAVGFALFTLVLVRAWQQVVKTTSVVTKATGQMLDMALQHRWKIVLMGAIPTFLLASSTELLSKGIASFPLMWVIPLMLYLVSFIVAFSGREFSRNIPMGFWALVSIVPVFALMPIINAHAVLYWLGFMYSMISFFLISVYFHQRVYQLRPRVADLGGFYVYLTLGGALGSGVVGLVLPFVLNDQIEVYFAFGALALYFSYHYLCWLRTKLPAFFITLMQGMVVLITILFVITLSATANLVASERNFYGTLRIIDIERVVNGEMIPVRAIVNGATNHGFQALDERYQSTAASYYGADSGIDIAIRSFVEKGISPRINVVGLGSGMMNAYCDRVASIDYIEINPAVEDLARNYFTYLEMCPDKTSVELGDGRLLLEEQVEQGDIIYDVIMMDAFTDDAIPSHLLTTEAFSQAYQPLLSEDGIVAFHVSNKYLNLFPPIVGLAHDNGYEVLKVVNIPDGSNQLHLPTVWVLVTSAENAEIIKETFPSAEPYTGRELVWTDDKNSVLSVLSLQGSMGEQASY